MQLISEMDKNLPIYESTQIVSKEISKLLENRFTQSIKLKNSDGTLLVYLFFNYPMEGNSNFEKRGQFYIGKDVSIESSSYTESFYTTSSSALINNITSVPHDLTSISVFYSLHVINKESVLNIKDEKVVFKSTEPKYSFEDVIINEDEKRAIMRALIMVKEKELAFDKWGYRKIDPSTKSILCFHGAPGTGKTMCAHAVAKYLGKKLLIARYSQIQSKYTGEGEKNLRAYFEEAEKQDAVLFIDEADTFLSKRLSSSNSNSKIYNSMSNELFQLIEDHNGCIIFASNLVTDFDPAVISRIIEPVEFKLPDKDTRIRIIKKLLPPGLPISSPLGDIDFAKLAEVSEGFSGRDIRKSMYVFIADKLYYEKEVNKKQDKDIEVTLDDIMIGFENVRESKRKLDDAVNNTNRIVNDFIKKEEANLRLIQIAALALWADGKVEPKEKQLFMELVQQYKVNVSVDEPEKLPKLEEICSKIHTKSEKLEILDIACRMIAFDGDYPEAEKQFVFRLLTLLGYKNEELKYVSDYINELIENYHTFEYISKNFEISQFDALSELKKEYTEGAAYYHLGLLYENGSSMFGGITKNPELADKCYKEAKRLGYSIKENQST